MYYKQFSQSIIPTHLYCGAKSMESENWENKRRMAISFSSIFLGQNRCRWREYEIRKLFSKIYCRRPKQSNSFFFFSKFVAHIRVERNRTRERQLTKMTQHIGKWFDVMRSVELFRSWCESHVRNSFHTRLIKNERITWENETDSAVDGATAEGNLLNWISSRNCPWNINAKSSWKHWV